MSVKTPSDALPDKGLIIDMETTSSGILRIAKIPEDIFFIKSNAPEAWNDFTAINIASR